LRRLIRDEGIEGRKWFYLGGKDISAQLVVCSVFVEGSRDQMQITDTVSRVVDRVYLGTNID